MPLGGGPLGGNHGGLQHRVGALHDEVGVLHGGERVLRGGMEVLHDEKEVLRGGAWDLRGEWQADGGQGGALIQEPAPVLEPGLQRLQLQQPAAPSAASPSSQRISAAPCETLVAR